MKVCVCGGILKYELKFGSFRAWYGTYIPYPPGFKRPQCQRCGEEWYFRKHDDALDKERYSYLELISAKLTLKGLEIKTKVMDNTIYFLNDKVHRELGPAVITPYSEWWAHNGFLHRDNGPAVIYKNGKKEWRQKGRLHREDGPAVELANGDQLYYLRGKFQKEILIRAKND